eukprot:scaffold465_cov383-Pavlova_lutheri.AAC.2
MGEEKLSKAFEAWWSGVRRWFGRRKAHHPDLEESESVVDLLDMIQGPKCAVLNSLYERGALPQDLGAFKAPLIQLHRIRPSSEAAYKELERAYQKRDMTVRHYLLHLEELQRKVNLGDGKVIPHVSDQMVQLKLRSSVWIGIRSQLCAKLEVDKLDGNERPLETMEDWLKLLEYCEEHHARVREARECDEKCQGRKAKAVPQKMERPSIVAAVPTSPHPLTPEQERFRAEWKGENPTPKAIEQCKQLGLCLIFRCLSPDHVANDCPNKGKSLETGNGQAPGNGIPRRAPSYVQGTELKTLWDTGAGCSYIHREFSTLGTIISKAHFVRSVFANGQTHTSSELVQISVALGPFDLPLDEQIKVIPMDLPKKFDMILGCDVMKQLQALLDVNRNTIQLRHGSKTITLVMDKNKTGEISSVNGLASVSVAAAELSAQHPTSFSTLEEEFGPFSTTLPVSPTAGLASLNYEEPVEAMKQDRTELPGRILCAPPLRLLPQVTQKLRASTPLDLVLLTPYLPNSPWFRELKPLLHNGRVIPSAKRTNKQQAKTPRHSAPACEMVAQHIDRNSAAETTTLGAIQENHPTVTREAVEGLQMPESLGSAHQQQLKHLLLKYLHLMQPPGDDEPPPPPSKFDHRIVLTEGGVTANPNPSDTIGR